MKNPFENVSPEVLELRKRQIERLSRNPKIIDLLKKNRKDMKFLSQNAAVLASWLDSEEMCQECTGLPNCAKRINSIAGMKPVLEFDEDGFMSEVLRPCRYLKEQSQKRTHLKNFWINHMDPDGEMVDLEKLSPVNETRAYLSAGLQLLGSVSADFGVYLNGQAGTGKSYLLSGVANKHALMNKSVCFVRLPRLISEIKQNLSDEQYRKEIMWDLIHCDVLILDDIGSEAASTWTRDEILFPVLDERMNQKRKTYFSSNLSMDNLKTHYMFARESNTEIAVSRLMDRIRSLAMPLPLLGESRRISPVV